MTEYLKLDKLDYVFSRQDQRVTISGEGVLEVGEGRLHGGQWTIPDTVGHLSLLVRGRSIGAVRTPFHGKRVQIEGSDGIAVVIQLDGHVSAAAQLAPFGAIALAAKLLEEVAAPYGSRPCIENCPPKLGAALTAVHEAVWEAKTMSRPIP